MLTPVELTIAGILFTACIACAIFLFTTATRREEAEPGLSATADSDRHLALRLARARLDRLSERLTDPKNELSLHTADSSDVLAQEVSAIHRHYAAASQMLSRLAHYRGALFWLKFIAGVVIFASVALFGAFASHQIAAQLAERAAVGTVGLLAISFVWEEVLFSNVRRSLREYSTIRNEFDQTS